MPKSASVDYQLFVLNARADLLQTLKKSRKGLNFEELQTKIGYKSKGKLAGHLRTLQFCGFVDKKPNSGGLDFNYFVSDQGSQALDSYRKLVSILNSKSISSPK